MNSILGYIPAAILLGYMIWLAFQTGRYSGNPKNLRAPKAVARDIDAIPYEELREQGVKVLVFDVDRTLCKLGLWWWQYEKDLPMRSKNLLEQLHFEYGFMIVLATKSNKNVHDMVRAMGSPPWMSSMQGPKDSARFAHNLSYAIEVLWKLPCDRNTAVIIGDKLTDMGLDIAESWRCSYGILVNPQGGHDFITETFPAARRWLERATLTGMGIKRATADEPFRWVSRPAGYIKGRSVSPVRAPRPTPRSR